MAIDTYMHIVPSITGDRIDSCTFGTLWGTNYVPGKDRNQLRQYLGVPMRCGMDPAILSGVTMHASSSERLARETDLEIIAISPSLGVATMVGEVWLERYVHVPGGDYSITPLCEIFPPHI